VVLFLPHRTTREQGVLIPNLAEVVDPIRAREQHGRDQAYRHVAPALFVHKNPIVWFRGSASSIEVFKDNRLGLAPLRVHISDSDLKAVPN